MHERDTLLDLIVVASSDAECQQQDDDVSVEVTTVGVTIIGVSVI